MLFEGGVLIAGFASYTPQSPCGILCNVMRSIIQFSVSKGDKFYVAECMDLPIVTQAKTLDALAGNIEEALALHMEDEDLSHEFAPHPSVLISFELPSKVHA